MKVNNRMAWIRASGQYPGRYYITIETTVPTYLCSDGRITTILSLGLEPSAYYPSLADAQLAASKYCDGSGGRLDIAKRKRLHSPMY